MIESRRVKGKLDGKRLGSEHIISGGSRLGNDYGLGLGRSDETSDGKRPGGEFGIQLVSKIFKDDGI